MAAMTDPGAAAARARVATLLERLTRVDLQVIVVAPPDATRLAARDRARAAAIAAGRTVLLDEATAGARETTLRAFARAGFSGTWAATDRSASVATASDRVAAAAAFEEAAMAAVVEDLVDDDTLEVLRGSSDELDSIERGAVAGLAVVVRAVGRHERESRPAAIFMVVVRLGSLACGRVGPSGSGSPSPVVVARRAPRRRSRPGHLISDRPCHPMSGHFSPSPA